MPKPKIVVPETRHEGPKQIITKKDAEEALISYFKLKAYGEGKLTLEPDPKKEAIKKAIKYAENTGNYISLKSHLEDEMKNQQLSRYHNLDKIYKILFADQNKESKNKFNVYEQVFKDREAVKKARGEGLIPSGAEGFTWSKKHNGWVIANSELGREANLERV